MLRISLVLSVCFVSTAPPAVGFRAQTNPYGPRVQSLAVRCMMSAAERFGDEGFLVMSEMYNMTSPAADIQLQLYRAVHEHGRWMVMVVGNDLDERSTSQRSNESAQLILKAHYYFLVVDLFGRLEDKIRQFQTLMSWSSRGLVVVYTSDSASRSNLDTARAFLHTLWRYKMYNTLIMMASRTDPTVNEIYTGFLYNESCVDITTMWIGNCDEGRVPATLRLFRNKIPGSIGECPISVYMRVSPPFVERGCGSGVEIKLLQVLQQRLHFTTQVTCFEDIERGKLSNSKWDGLLGKLLEDKADLAVAGLYPDPDYGNYLDSTESYFEDSFTWVVPPALEMPHFMALIVIFRYRTWITLVAMYVFTSGVWFAMGRAVNETDQHRTIAGSLFNNLCIFLGVSVYHRPTSGALRFLFIILALYGMNMTTAYQTKLITALTRPQLFYQIDDMAGLLASELALKGDSDLLGWFTGNGWIDTGIRERFQPMVEDDLQQVAIGGKVSVLMNRFKVGARGYARLVHAIKQNMISFQLVMAMPAGFPLSGRLNRMISLLKSNGVISKLDEDMKYSANRRELINLWVKKRFSPLSIDHVQGAFVTLVAGYVISTAVFIWEILSRVDFKRILYFCRNLFLHYDRKFSFKYFMNPNRVTPKRTKGAGAVFGNHASNHVRRN